MIQMSGPFARITSMFLQTTAMNDAFDHFRDASAPAVREQPGSLAILSAANPETGFSCAISFWQTLESIERSNGNPRVVEAMGGYAQWMAGPFRVASYTVASGTYPDPDTDQAQPAWLRMTTTTAVPGRRDTVLDAYAERLNTAGARSAACTWTTVLAPTIGSEIVAIEHWTSLPALNAWDATAKDADQRLFRSGAVESPPVRDRLAVYGLY